MSLGNEMSCWYGPISFFKKNWVCSSGEIDESHVADVEDLYVMPKTWREFPHSLESRLIGDDWVSEKSSSVLSVPSAVLGNSRNFLLNPEHPDFGSIEFSEIEDLDLDPRL